MGLSLVDRAEPVCGSPCVDDTRCILLFLVGGPSQLDTWDPKPNAPESVRGPFWSIRTTVPGIELSELFPRMASMADQFALVRSVHHSAAPVHETGHQLMQTGRLFQHAQEHPHYGSVVSHLRGPVSHGAPPFVLLPEPIGYTGISVSHGQGSAYLGPEHEPACICPEPGDSDRYGRTTFGQSCLLARQLVERGTRFVTVNMFQTVFNEITWDCHADRGSLPTTLDDYRRTLCPMFDLAYTALLDDLHQRGLLDRTLVVAMGEFGRTPQLNPRGGRDHWPGVWTILFAGGGVRGGQVIGASDQHGAEPKDRPVTPAEVGATIYQALGIDPALRLHGQPLVDAPPIMELFS